MDNQTFPTGSHLGNTGWVLGIMRGGNGLGSVGVGKSGQTSTCPAMTRFNKILLRVAENRSNAIADDFLLKNYMDIITGIPRANPSGCLRMAALNQAIIRRLAWLPCSVSAGEGELGFVGSVSTLPDESDRFVAAGNDETKPAMSLCSETAPIRWGPGSPNGPANRSAASLSRAWRFRQCRYPSPRYCLFLFVPAPSATGCAPRAGKAHGEPNIPK